MAGGPGTPTVLLQRLRAGDEDAAGPLFELLYAELRRIAGRVFRSQRSGHTLQPTALVHEAFLKLTGGEGDRSWESRAHFCNLAARAMRQILVNHARDRAALKRGGPDAKRFTIGDADAVVDGGMLDVLALDEALAGLAEVEPRLGRIAELRIFGGLSSQEAGEVLRVSKRTVETDWQLAKAFLIQRLQETG